MARLTSSMLPEYTKVKAFFKDRDLDNDIAHLKLDDGQAQVLRNYLEQGDVAVSNLPDDVAFKVAYFIYMQTDMSNPPQVDLTKGHPCGCGSQEIRFADLVKNMDPDVGPAIVNGIRNAVDQANQECREALHEAIKSGTIEQRFRAINGRYVESLAEQGIEEVWFPTTVVSPDGPNPGDLILDEEGEIKTFEVTLPPAVDTLVVPEGILNNPHRVTAAQVGLNNMLDLADDYKDATVIFVQPKDFAAELRRRYIQHHKGKKPKRGWPGKYH
jgi:hypothetical protein